MDGGRISPASSSSSSAAGKRPYSGRRRQPGQSPEEDEEEEQVACTGKSCKSCTAGVIADCVAVCCCPCAVVNILTLTFVKLPWAVARRCIGRRRRRRRSNNKRKMLEEKRSKCCHHQREMNDRDAARGREEPAAVESVYRCGGATAAEEEGENDGFGTEEVWWDLYEVGHLGFGRVSFTGISFSKQG